MKDKKKVANSTEQTGFDTIMKALLYVSPQENKEVKERAKKECKKRKDK